MKNKAEYFDDCAVCQAMEKAEKEGRKLGMNELLAAFEKANAEQAVNQKKTNN